MGKIKETDKELIQELIRHPGWLVLEKKATIILNNANQRVLTSSTGEFNENKGFYRGVKLFHDLILLKPLDIADTQGIIKLKGEG